MEAYRRTSRMSARIWREHGALEFRVCIGHDLNGAGVLPFPRPIEVKSDETVAFAWVMFKSRAHRDRVNAKVMQDPRFAKLDPQAMPFDTRRLVYGGFKVIVDA